MKKSLNPSYMTIGDLMEQHGIRSVPKVVSNGELSPNWTKRSVDEFNFQEALERMRQHYTAEEIKWFVEDRFQLQSTVEAMKEFLVEVSYPLKNYLEMKQADLTDKQKDLLDEGLERYGGEIQTDAKDCLELGYWSVDLFDDIMEILKDRV